MQKIDYRRFVIHPPTDNSHTNIIHSLHTYMYTFTIQLLNEHTAASRGAEVVALGSRHPSRYRIDTVPLFDTSQLLHVGDTNARLNHVVKQYSPTTHPSISHTIAGWEAGAKCVGRLSCTASLPLVASQVVITHVTLKREQRMSTSRV